MEDADRIQKQLDDFYRLAVAAQRYRMMAENPTAPEFDLNAARAEIDRCLRIVKFSPLAKAASTRKGRRRKVGRAKQPLPNQKELYQKLWRSVEGATADAFMSHKEYLTPQGRSNAVLSVTKRVVGALMSLQLETRKGGHDE